MRKYSEFVFSLNLIKISIPGNAGMCWLFTRFYAKFEQLKHVEQGKLGLISNRNKLGGKEKARSNVSIHWNIFGWASCSLVAVSLREPCEQQFPFWLAPGSTGAAGWDFGVCRVFGPSHQFVQLTCLCVLCLLQLVASLTTFFFCASSIFFLEIF